MKKGGQKPRAGIKNATENFFLCTISGFYNKGRKKVTFLLKISGFKKQRLWSVNKSLSHLHILKHFFFHSFWFGLMAAWREHIYTEDFIMISGVFCFNLKCKEWFLKIRDTVQNLDMTQAKVFISYSIVKIQVRKFAGSSFHGNISDVHHLSMHSQCTDIKGTGTQKYNGQGVHWTGPNIRAAQVTVLLAAGLLFDGGPADTGITLWYWFMILFAIYLPIPISSPGEKWFPASIFPCPSIMSDRRVGLRLWAGLSMWSADRC